MDNEHVDIEKVWKWLEEIPDPEIPVVSIVDLGMIRNVIVDQGQIIIKLAPTYSGCPALDTIESSIYQKLKEHGLAGVDVVKTISPPWTTDWISDSGRQKLKAYGIAPPQKGSRNKPVLTENPQVECPQCNSLDTEVISNFGSTPCKALYKCLDCLEPFDYFKCH